MSTASSGRVKPQVPSGVEDLSPLAQRQHNLLLGRVRNQFERYGFTPLHTAHLQRREVLTAKTEGEIGHQLYFIRSARAEDTGSDPNTALRFDLTVPLARYVAQHDQQLWFPFRRYHIGSVFRGERAQAGRFREFIQCDIDIVDRNHLSLGADAEITAVIYAVFTDLEIGEFTIRISNRKILLSILGVLGISDPEHLLRLLRIIDRWDKVGADAVVDALGEEGLSPVQTSSLVDLLGLTPRDLNGAEQLAADIRAEFGSALDSGVGELSEVCERILELGVPPEAARLDLSIARGLDYYTGTVYETKLDGHEELGSICSGGRYDDLASAYSSSQLPGVGISIGWTRLFSQLQTTGLLPTSVPSVVKVLITNQEGSSSALLTELAITLRREGWNTEVRLEPARLKAQLRYAQKAQIPLVLLCGAQEQEQGVVVVKNMQTGTETAVQPNQLLNRLQQEMENPTR